MFGRKTLEDKFAEIIRLEFGEIIADLEGDHREYRRRLKLKKETRAALEKSEEEVQKLHSHRIELKKRFWEAYYEKEVETDFSEIEYEGRLLERATKKAEKFLVRARMDFESADFDEVAKGFSLRTKANIAEDEVNRRIDALEETLEDLLAGVRHGVKEASEALREEYKEPRFDTVEEQNAHVERTIEILNAVAESYTPGFRWRSAQAARNAREAPQGTEDDAPRPAAEARAKSSRPWWFRVLGRSQ
jgi:hypothetical protein